MGVEKDTVSLGRTHEQLKCLHNKGKTNKTTVGLVTGLKLDQKLLLHREKRQKDKWFHFHAATALLCWVRAASGPFFGEQFICT